jgi:glycosyltransferase involved in cell wall biosynthesis
MKYPFVSVIIPLYNYTNYICDTIKSCYAQKYKGDMEVIVVDDKSTDGSLSNIKSRFHKRPLKIVQHLVNKGYSAAKNSGIRSSKGDLIVLIDADDMLTPDSIAIRAEYLMEHPDVDMVRGTVYCIDGFGGYDYYLKRMYKLRIYGKRKVQAQTTMLRRRVHLDFGLYDENLRSRSDRRNPAYNNKVTELLERAKKMRREEGINKKNTPWLKK